MDHLSVLVVDDSVTIRAMIQQIVEREPGGRVVGFASSVEEAKRVLDTLHPNVITLDLCMPGADGMELLRYLRDRPHPPVVVLSSTTTGGAVVTADALAQGADACFDKSKVVSDARGFVQMLRSAVRRKNRQAAAARTQSRRTGTDARGSAQISG